MTPTPITLTWRGNPVRIRHDDPGLTAYSDVVRRQAAAMTITSEVRTLRLVMADERAYEVRVDDDGGTVKLRRRPQNAVVR